MSKKYSVMLLIPVLVVLTCITTLAGSAYAMGFNKIKSGSINVDGYFENWVTPSGTYDSAFAPYGRVMYSFLTLSAHPSADNPPNERWDGNAVYETMTLANILTVMTKTDPTWNNPYDWQRVKIQSMIDACHASGKKFIWAVGGWSDLTQAIYADQTPALVNILQQLLKLGGDGIDFDWEHLSNNPSTSAEFRKNLGNTMVALRKAVGPNYYIGYTTRYNSFWKSNGIPAGFSLTSYPSDGEGIDVVQAIKNSGQKPENVLTWVNLMTYDIAPQALNPGPSLSLADFVTVLSTSSQYVSKSLLQAGFEPGTQAGGGIREGVTIDKEVIDYVKANQYGGVFFWALNDRNNSGNCTTLADYADAAQKQSHSKTK